MFRSGSHVVSDGDWSARLGGKLVRMPLRSETIWLDWDSAVSICGHDIEVKETYENFLESKQVPDLFVDIGANYGTHSLIFLVHGINSVSFEPNQRCHVKFREMCHINGVSPHIESVALGSEEGRAVLRYAEHETWSGSIYPEMSTVEKPNDDVHVEEVPQRTIDSYFAENGREKMLIKIDAEGSERAILCGGRRTLQDRRPVTIFESHVIDGTRQEILDFFEGLDYRIYRMPYRPDEGANPLSREEFLGSTQENFIAVPAQMVPMGRKPV